MKKKYKKISFDINLSSPFVIRDVCIHCGSPPQKYTYSSSKTIVKELKPFHQDNDLANQYLTINYNISKSDNMSVKNFNKFKYLNITKYSITDKSFSIKAHKTKDKQLLDKEYYDVEIVQCKCGMTSWGFSNNSVKDRPDITNRKANKNYPKKVYFKV